MNTRKTAIRFFTIADYEKEEVWLRNQHINGWKLKKMIPPCFYIFEKCAPEDVAYRLDYKNNAETADYFRLFGDYGWEYIGCCVGWLYFRKKASEINSEQDTEIFSDNESKVDMINYVVKTRLIPVTIIFFCCVLPNFIGNIKNGESIATILFGAMTALYVYLLLYCGLTLQKLRKKYKNQ